MTMKKLAIVSAIAMMSMGSVYAQQTTVTTTNAATPVETGGLMTTLAAAILTLSIPVPSIDVSAIGGAVNLSAINGGINITGTNVSLAGVTGALTGLSTTVIGAMNSSTLDVSKKTIELSEKTQATLNIGVLNVDGTTPVIASQAFTPGSFALATPGADILGGGAAATQFSMQGLVSGTETTATSLTNSLQKMNVFNMAVNMAPLVAGVNIAAAVDPGAFFLSPQTGVVNLAGLQVATTSIGAMNSSITRLGAKLSN